MKRSEINNIITEAKNFLISSFIPPFGYWNRMIGNKRIKITLMKLLIDL